jgi:hypothetical protein
VSARSYQLQNESRRACPELVERGRLNFRAVQLVLKDASVQQPPFPWNDPLLFVIPSVPGFPAALLSSATPDVVLFKENHTPPTEAATLDRKSGEAEGSAVRHSCAPLLPAHNRHQSSPNPHGKTNLPFVILGFQEWSAEPQIPSLPRISC